MPDRLLTTHDVEELAKLARQANKSVFYRTVAMISVALLGVGLVFAAHQYGRAEDAAREASQAAVTVRAAAIQNCQKSLQPGGIRFIIADGLRHQIDQSKTLDYQQFFPNVPPRQLEGLIAHQRQQQEQQIKDLKSVNCVQLYPAPKP